MVYRVVKTDAYLLCYISICSTLFDMSVLYHIPHKLCKVASKQELCIIGSNFIPEEVDLLLSVIDFLFPFSYFFFFFFDHPIKFAVAFQFEIKRFIRVFLAVTEWKSRATSAECMQQGISNFLLIGYWFVASPILIYRRIYFPFELFFI